MNEGQICNTHPGLSGPNWLEGCEGIVSMTPAPGWTAEVTLGDGTLLSTPLIGWGIQCNGLVKPIVCDDGSPDPVALEYSSFVRLMHDGKYVYGSLDDDDANATTTPEEN